MTTFIDNLTQEKILNEPLPFGLKEISAYLSQFKEEMPEWLSNYRRGSKVTFSDIMSGRVGYYPGSEYDRNLIEVGIKSHTIHSFLHVDYGVSKKDLLDHLYQDNFIKGYHIIGRKNWKEKDFLPNGQYPLNIDLQGRTPKSFIDEKPYCITLIMGRNANLGDEWGVKRFAITYLFADGITYYYQLFCKEYKKAPWMFLLQDHGFGGNYDIFGKYGFLDEIITKNGIRPGFVLCADNTPIWEGYDLVTGLPPVHGGMHHFERRLYRNIL